MAKFFLKNHVCIFNKTKQYIKIMHDLAYQQNQKIFFIFYMHHGFNNKFIKVTRI
jgi:hypothetical protein